MVGASQGLSWKWLFYSVYPTASLTCWLKQKRFWAVTQLAMLCCFSQVLGPGTLGKKHASPLVLVDRSPCVRLTKLKGKSMEEGVKRGLRFLLRPQCLLEWVSIWETNDPKTVMWQEKNLKGIWEGNITVPKIVSGD